MMGRRVCVCLLGLTWFLVIRPAATALMTDEGRLITYLTYNYKKLHRPVVNISQSVQVKFGIALLSLYEVNEASGYIITDTWFRYLWTDPQLKWNPEDFGQIDHVHIPGNLLWRPDIVLYNGVNAETALVEKEDAMAIVTSNGEILYIPQVTLKSRCSFDMRYFPFDEQKCIMKFGSWTYDSSKLDIDFYGDRDEFDVTDYIVSNEWDLVEHTANKNLKHYPCCEEAYPDLTFTLGIKRRESFYSHVFIVPGIFMSFLTPIIFALPSGGAPRYVLGTGLLITLAVTFSGFDEMLPRVNSTPVIGRWYAALECLVIIALILSGFVTNLANRATQGQAPPALIKKILVDMIGRVLRVGGGNVMRLSEDSDKGTGNHPSEWELVARVLDRLFFLIYCGILFILMLFCTTA